MLPGETVASGAPLEVCEMCKQTPTLGVYRSGAGYYVGYACCEPYSRESGYYASQAAAEAALDRGDFGRAPGHFPNVPGKGASW